MRRAVAILCAALLLLVCAVASAAVAPSGIVGRVVEGPTCPVERVPPDPSCAPRPLMARLLISRIGSQVSRSVVSGADGRFRVRLAPGAYVVRAQRLGISPFPRPSPPVTVRVTPHHFTRITIAYDTGIR